MQYHATNEYVVATSRSIRNKYIKERERALMVLQDFMSSSSYFIELEVTIEF